MSASFERRLRELDRALVALAEERLRLRTLAARARERPATALEDLLRRHDGALTAERVRALFAALDELTEPPTSSGPCASRGSRAAPGATTGDGEVPS